MAGTWVGTLDLPQMSTRSITLTVVQSGNCVDGSWISSPSGWSGAISGFAGQDSYSGQVSFERAADDGGRCTVTGNVVGAVSADALTWTVSGLAPVGSCSGLQPVALAFTLQKR